MFPCLKDTWHNFLHNPSFPEYILVTVVVVETVVSSCRSYGSNCWRIIAVEVIMITMVMVRMLSIGQTLYT